MNRNILTYMVSALLIALVSCESPESITIKLSPDRCLKPGRFVPDGDIPTVKDLALDAYCAEQLVKRAAPDGVITIFGSARAKEGMESYDNTRKFAFLWTKEMGKKYPILTGGGPGIMEAGNRGAKEAKGASLFFSSYFGKGTEKPNTFTTDGYMFASFSQREAEMVDRAAAILIAPGGFGTEWEIFESLAKLQTEKKNKVPVVLLGKKIVWRSLINRINFLKKIKTISTYDSTILQIAETPEKAVKIIKDFLSSKK